MFATLALNVFMFLWTLIIHQIVTVNTMTNQSKNIFNTQVIKSIKVLGAFVGPKGIIGIHNDCLKSYMEFLEYLLL